MRKKDRKRKRQRDRSEQTRKDGFKGYEDIVKENEAYEKYYKAQKIVPEEEWNTFMSTLRENLPVTFRITGSKSHAKSLLNIIQSEYFSQLLNSAEDSTIEEKPFCLPWYPDELAWQLNLSRKCIRKSEAFLKLHNFLIYETNGGYISRQESVSMIPPLLLDVHPYHKVLDMCAAPGSKTAQLIEMLHAQDDAIPTGLLIANDVDNKRCYMLVHQAKRLHSPCFIITNHDASSMPNIRFKKDNAEVTNLKFDRILCDVPCSGDGTLRKNYDVWPKWNAANGNNFHGIQSRIGRRGLELLDVGGLLVYSTCSLNPIEDEAVIHHLLVESKGSVELVDVSTKLHGLKFCPGLSKWTVMNRDLTPFEKFEEVPEKYITQIRPHMFPPDSDKAGEFHLDRCMRILPHHQNTGGFFVAVMKKIAPLPGEKIVLSTVAKTNKNHEDDNGCSSPPRKRFKVYGFKEDPFFFFDKNEEVWPPIRDFYGIDPNFDSTCLLTRCQTGKKRNIYLVSAAIKEIVVNNADRIKIINTGMKIFSRNENKGATCGFRLTQEGIHIMLPFITKRCVDITQNDLVLLLTSDYPFNSKMSEDTRKQLQQLGDSGCVILKYKMEQYNDNPLYLVLCGWKGATSIRAYVPKSEQIHYLRLCGVDTSKFERNRNKNQNPSELNDGSGEAVADNPEIDNDDVSVPIDEDSFLEDKKIEEIPAT